MYLLVSRGCISAHRNKMREMVLSKVRNRYFYCKIRPHLCNTFLCNTGQNFYLYAKKFCVLKQKYILYLCPYFLKGQAET